MNRYTEPDFAASALVTIDTQRDTLDGQPLEVPGTSAILPDLRRLIAAFRQRQLPIVHIVRIYKTDGSNADLIRRSALEQGVRMFAPGTPGVELADGLLPPHTALDCEQLLSGRPQRISEHESILYKPRWGAFYHTALEALLREASVNTVVFSGCNFPNCPRASVVEASERDFRVVLVADAVSGFDDRGHREMANIGAAILTTDVVVGAVAGTRERVAAGARSRLALSLRRIFVRP